MYNSSYYWNKNDIDWESDKSDVISVSDNNSDSSSKNDFYDDDYYAIIRFNKFMEKCEEQDNPYLYDKSNIG